MPTIRTATALLLCLGTTTLVGCGGSKGNQMLMRESFSSDDTYSRSFDAPPEKACEAARRALLSQGYAIARADASVVEGTKSFQPNDESHEQLGMRVSCATQGEDKSWVFVSALQDRYALKKSSTSASVGVGVLGSVSLPVGSSDDSLVRVASSTVQDGEFYRHFFQRMQQYLPAVGKPAADKTVQPAAPAVATPPPASPAAPSTTPSTTPVTPPAVDDAMPAVTGDDTPAPSNP